MSGCPSFSLKSSRGLLLFAALAGCLASGGSGRAASLVTYLFTTSIPSNTEFLAPDSGSVPANVSAGNITDHVVTGETTNSAFSSTTRAFFARSGTLDATEAAAVITADPEYIAFTLAANSGYALSLSQLTFQLGSTAASTPYTVNAALRSSLDDFAGDIGTYSVTKANTGSTPAYNLQTQTLSGAQFQSVAGSIEFRIYLWDNLDDNTNDIARLDEVKLSGTVAAAAVPEPATGALMAGLAVCLVAVGRRGFRRTR